MAFLVTPSMGNDFFARQARAGLGADAPVGKPIDRTNRHSSAPNSTASQLNESIEQNKSQSVAYQLMRAIARQNVGNEKLVGKNCEPAGRAVCALDDFSVNFQYDKITQQSLSLSSASSVFDDFSENSFSIEAEFRSLETFELRFVDPVNQQELRFEITQQTSFSFSASSQNPEPEQADPLLLDLDGKGFHFDPGNSYLFDLDADGQEDKLDTLAPGSAFLAFDKNANGMIDNGTELFGDASGAQHGFADLARYDDNQDGQIDAQDNVFNSLMLLNFGSEGEQHLRPLSSQNIESLSLNHQAREQLYAQADQLIFEAKFKREDGSSGVVGDFLLAMR